MHVLKGVENGSTALIQVKSLVWGYFVLAVVHVVVFGVFYGTTAQYGSYSAGDTLESVNHTEYTCIYIKL